MRRKIVETEEVGNKNQIDVEKIVETPRCDELKDLEKIDKVPHDEADCAAGPQVHTVLREGDGIHGFDYNLNGEKKVLCFPVCIGDSENDDDGDALHDVQEALVRHAEVLKRFCEEAPRFIALATSLFEEVSTESDDNGDDALPLCAFCGDEAYFIECEVQQFWLLFHALEHAKAPTLAYD